MRERALGDRHPDGIADALPERTRRRLDAGGEMHLRMSGRAAPPLPKRLQVVEGQVVAGQIQEAVEQHAAVTGGEHEAIAVRPMGIARVVSQMALPERVRHRRRAERQPGMARVRLLDGIDRECADAIDAA